MKFIKRITRITTGRIEAFLSEAESPETLLPQLAKEMDREVHLVARAEAKSLAGLRTVQRKLDELMGQSLRLERGTELAVQQGDDETAREAITAQIQVEKEIELAQKILKTSESAYEQARNAHLKIRSELEDLNQRKDEIIAKAQNAKIRSSIPASTALRTKNGKGILGEVSKMEAKIDEDEAKTDILKNLEKQNSMPLELRLREIERKSEIEKRIQQLKKN